MSNSKHILENIEPTNVFYFFEEISRIPHGSGNTKEISDYLVDFAKNRNLEFYQDDFDNVIIYKSENISNENISNLNNNLNIEPIILQGHIDMVCEKSLKSSKNMELESIDLEIDGDFITAKETTLGADNGIAVAMILAILDDNNLNHPPIEAVFTSDEEIGLIGASNLDMSKLKGKSLINLDSEEEGFMVVSCAGGNRLDIEIPVDTLEYSKEDLSLDYGIIDISIEGLKGGHSGIEIDKGLANANKILGKLLKEFNENDVDFNLIDISGGNLDNAIPNSSFSTILIRDINKIKDIAKEFEIKVNEEFKGIEDKIEVNLDFKEFSKINISDDKFTVLLKDSTDKIIDFINTVPNGIIKMSENIEGLVETSLNLGIMSLKMDRLNNFNVTMSIRSSLNAEKEKLNREIKSITKRFLGTVKIRGDYPGWEFKEDSPLQKLVCDVYENQYNKSMVVEIIHAGLECGVFVNKIDNLDAISIGPTLLDVHSYNEKMSISSVFRTYNLLLAILEKLAKV